jgi:2-isopropylmalate synthase
MHVSAVQAARTLRHRSEAVGNRRRVLVSELAGKSNILWKAREYGIDLDQDTPDSRRILEQLKSLEDQGFQFEGAEASFELLMERALGRHRPYFVLEAYRVTSRSRALPGRRRGPCGCASRACSSTLPSATAPSTPDHACVGAEEFYRTPDSLLDYKVRILDEAKATGARTRVLVTSGDGDETWGTVGVADNIIEASWQALVDSIEFKLRRDDKRAAR